MTPNLLAGVILGALSGIWAVSVRSVLEEEATILLAVGGAAVALLAVVLAAIALMTGFLRDFFGRLIQSAMEMTIFFRPFKIVAVVSAGAVLSSFAGAMDSASGPEWLQAALFGLATGLMVWAVVGTVGLVSVFVRYAERQRQLEGFDIPAKE